MSSGILADHAALPLELTRLGRLHVLSILDWLPPLADDGLMAALVELCCGCRGLRELHLTMGGPYDVGVDHAAWLNGVEGVRAALALRAWAGVIAEIGFFP